jgi:hypothetical protein
MSDTEKLIKILAPNYTRKYKGGIEMRVSNFEHSKSEALAIIAQHQLKLRIGDPEIRLRSFVVYSTE